MRIGSAMYGDVRVELWDCGHPYNPPAPSQTVKADEVPSYMITYNRIRSQIAAGEESKKRLEASLQQLRRRDSLESSAGTRSQTTVNQINATVKQINTIEKGLAQLKLQEFNLRTQYGIPEEKKPTR